MAHRMHARSGGVATNAIEELPERVMERMIATRVWHSDCPVPLEDLRYLTVPYVDFGGRDRTGELVVHRSVATDVLGVLEKIYQAGFPIDKMRLIEEYSGSDDASMADNNTSAFNCRYVAGTTRYSRHSWGKAIDINPMQNPYIRGSKIDPPGSEIYVDRDNVRAGMIVAGDVVVRAFGSIGWGWGGTWRSLKDYQHFDKR